MNWLLLTGRPYSADEQARTRKAALIGGLVLIGVILAMLLLREML